MIKQIHQLASEFTKNIAKNNNHNIQIQLINNEVLINCNDKSCNGLGKYYFIYSNYRLDLYRKTYNKKEKPIIKQKEQISQIKKYHMYLWYLFKNWRKDKLKTQQKIFFQKIIGCDLIFFNNYINQLLTDQIISKSKEQKMPWCHDHIMPLSTAWLSNVYDINEQKIILEKLWFYQNIQPLSWIDNSKKGGYRNLTK